MYLDETFIESYEKKRWLHIWDCGISITIDGNKDKIFLKESQQLFKQKFYERWH